MTGGLGDKEFIVFGGMIVFALEMKEVGISPAEVGAGWLADQSLADAG